MFGGKGNRMVPFWVKEFCVPIPQLSGVSLLRVCTFEGYSWVTGATSSRLLEIWKCRVSIPMGRLKLKPDWWKNTEAWFSFLQEDKLCGVIYAPELPAGSGRAGPSPEITPFLSFPCPCPDAPVPSLLSPGSTVLMSCFPRDPLSGAWCRMEEETWACTNFPPLQSSHCTWVKHSRIWGSLFISNPS